MFQKKLIKKVVKPKELQMILKSLGLQKGFSIQTNVPIGFLCDQKCFVHKNDKILNSLVKLFITSLSSKNGDFSNIIYQCKTFVIM